MINFFGITCFFISWTVLLNVPFEFTINHFYTNFPVCDLQVKLKEALFSENYILVYLNL
jgi:hypothetical protein